MLPVQTSKCVIFSTLTFVCCSTHKISNNINRYTVRRENDYNCCTEFVSIFSTHPVLLCTVISQIVPALELYPLNCTRIYDLQKRIVSYLFSLFIKPWIKHTLKQYPHFKPQEISNRASGICLRKCGI